MSDPLNRADLVERDANEGSCHSSNKSPSVTHIEPTIQPTSYGDTQKFQPYLYRHQSNIYSVDETIKERKSSSQSGFRLNYRQINSRDTYQIAENEVSDTPIDSYRLIKTKECEITSDEKGNSQHLIRSIGDSSK